MKATQEPLSATRVRLTVEVPFEELTPSVDAAYKKIARQVRVQGFRPGKVPPRILDQRVGRGYVLDQAVQDALPRLYTDAVREQSLPVLGNPEVDITSFSDGGPLVFTAEVDVRPEIEVPDYTGLPVTVDDATVTDEQVDEQLSSLRERFAVLQAADRPAQQGDYVSIDLAATVDGEPVPGAEATGMSHEVGRGGLIEGLDETLVGMSEGETRTFQTQLVAGEHAGRTADVAVTVRNVKAKELPDLDDDFAQTASEFDTLAELQGDIRARLERVARLQQGLQARDRALDALLERAEVPLPEAVVADEVASREQSIAGQLEQAGVTRDTYLQAEGKTEEEFRAELQEAAAKAVKAQFVLDAIVEKEQLGATDAEITETVVRRAQRAGMNPDDYVQRLVQSGGLPALMAEVVRGKALAQVLESANVTDASGRPVDLEALREDTPAPVAPDDAAAPAEQPSGALAAEPPAAAAEEPTG